MSILRTVECTVFLTEAREIAASGFRSDGGPGGPDNKEGPQKGRYLFFFLAALAIFMAAINSTIVATALPTLIRELGATIDEAGWVLIAYRIGQILVMPISGRLSDSWGRKRVFLLSIGLFTTASFLCGLAPNAFWLIVFRFLQALGGGSFVPSATGIIAQYFGSERDKAIGLFSSIFPLGGLIGPALGGLIVATGHWRAIFFVNVPIGLALLLLSAKFLPKETTSHLTRVDFTSVGLLGGGLVGLTFSANRFAEVSGTANAALLWIPALAGALLIVMFLRRQGRISEPLIDLELFRKKSFALVNAMNFFHGACSFGFFSFVPLYAEAALGMSALQAGGMLSIRAMGMIVASMITSLFLLRSLGYRIPMALGFLILSGGLFMTANPSLSSHDMQFAYLWFSTAMAVSGMGIGLVGPSSNNAALDLMPERVAAVAGLRGMFRQVGGIVGTSVVVFVLGRAGNVVLGLEQVFIGMGVVLLFLVVGSFFVPERVDRAQGAKA